MRSHECYQLPVYKRSQWQDEIDKWIRHQWINVVHQQLKNKPYNLYMLVNPGRVSLGLPQSLQKAPFLSIVYVMVTFSLQLLRCTCRKFSFTLWVWFSVKPCNKTIITAFDLTYFMRYWPRILWYQAKPSFIISSPTFYWRIEVHIVNKNIQRIWWYTKAQPVTELSHQCINIINQTFLCSSSAALFLLWTPAHRLTWKMTSRIHLFQKNVWRQFQ